MQRMAFVLASLAVVSFALLGGCGAKDGGKDAAKSGDAKATAKAMTPKETVDSFFKSFMPDGKKWETAKPIMTKKAQEYIDLVMKMEEGEEEGMKVSSFTIADEKIDGDKAVMTVKTKEKRKDGTDKDEEEVIVNLKKEDGTWKIYGLGKKGSKEMNFEDEEQLKQMKEFIKMMEEKKDK